VITGTKSQFAIDGETVTAPLSIRVAEDFTKTIGSSGTPLTLGTTTPVSDVYFAGKAATYVHVATAIVLTNCVCRTTNKAATAFNIGGAGTVTNLIVLAGRATLQGGLTCTNTEVGLLGGSGDADLTIEASVTAASLNQASGRVTCASDITTILLGGGVCSFSAGDITTLNLTGGSLIYKTDGGDIATANCMQGLLDLSQEGSAKTLGSAAVRVWSQAVIDTTNGAGGVNVTWSTTPSVFGGGRGILQAGGSQAVNYY
jgi:hypothetical protein